LLGLWIGTGGTSLARQDLAHQLASQALGIGRRKPDDEAFSALAGNLISSSIAPARHMLVRACT
jgi:hypothetical protein